MIGMINYNDVTETKLHTFATEASDLGLKPGQWPERLSTTIGNKMPFQRFTKKLDAEGELIYVRYRQLCGCVDLIVFND